jgi:hypothetical protein
MPAEIEVCEHGINVKYCEKCKRDEERKALRSLHARVKLIMSDGAWHTPKEIAVLTGGLLDTTDEYQDICRSVRLLRSEYEVEKKHVEKGVWSYRVSGPKKQEPQDAEKPDERDAEIAFLKEYVSELEAALALLKKEHNAQPKVS